MEIREATAADWAAIWPFFHTVVAAGETFPYPLDLDEEGGHAVWMLPPPARVTVAENAGRVLGSATMYANREGNGDHVASASYLVDPSWHGRGVGRALVRDSLDWARAAGFLGMQFNAVNASNPAAVHLYESLGFAVVGTVPEAFRHPREGHVGVHVMYRKL